MQRLLILAGGGLLVSATLAWAQESAWRPAAAGTGVGLGRPTSARPARPAEAASSSPDVVVSRYSDPRTVVRAQSDGLPPTTAGSPEEAYNCGVVSDGAGAGAGGGHPWFGNLGSGLNNLFGGTGSGASGFNFQSDTCFNRFISPVSNPFFFEDPRSLTEVRPIYIFQKIPGRNAVFQGGDLNGFYVQGRLALSPNFSIVMNKIGYLDLNPNAALVPSGQGLTELQIGPKFTFLRNEQSGTVAAAGVTFEFPVGSSKVFQDTGTGSVTPYLSFGQQFGDNFHFLTTAGYRFSYNHERTDMGFLSMHLDYGLYNRIFPLVELNWFHYTKNGSSFPANFEGADLINFGSTDVSGGNLVTLAAGVRFKIVPESVQAGVVFEVPLTNHRDILDYRITADLIFRY